MAITAHSIQLKPGYKQTDVGVIPEDWEVCSLGKVLTLQRGFDLPYKERQPGNVPIVSSSGISGTHSEAKVSGPGVVTGRYGTIGQVFFVSEDFWPLNTTLFVKDFKGNDPLFLSFLLPTLDFQAYSDKSGVPGVNRNDLHQIVVRLPPSPEQRAIAAALSDADALIASLDRLIAKKRDIKQATMQQLLTGKTRLPGFGGELKTVCRQTDVGVIPEDWEVVTLGSCLELLTDFEANGSFADVASNVTVLDQEDFAWYVRATDLENNSPLSAVRYVTQQSYNYLKKTALHGGEVLVTKRGEIGKVYLFKKCSIHATLAPNLYLLKFNGKVEPQFVYFYLKYGRGNRALKMINASTTLGALYKDDVKSLAFPLPPLPEQQAIVTIFSDMDAEIAALEQKRDKTRALKQGMIQELLTGRIRLV